jgi:hypothetical protein
MREEWFEFVGHVCTGLAANFVVPFVDVITDIVARAPADPVDRASDKVLLMGLRVPKTDEVANSDANHEDEENAKHGMLDAGDWMIPTLMTFPGRVPSPGSRPG